jgi:hypothetical protein
LGERESGENDQRCQGDQAMNAREAEKVFHGSFLQGRMVGEGRWEMRRTVCRSAAPPIT